jgi:transporter family-2 protein
MPLHLFFTFAIGCLVTIHVAMNARIGSLTGNGNLANTVFWLVGCATSLLIGGMTYEPGFASRLVRAPGWLLLAGAIGAFIAAFNNAMIPRIGVANLIFFLFLGQVVASAAIAGGGWLGTPREALTPIRLAGMLLIVTGTFLFAYGNRWFRSA